MYVIRMRTKACFVCRIIYKICDRLRVMFKDEDYAIRLKKKFTKNYLEKKFCDYIYKKFTVKFKE